MVLTEETACIPARGGLESTSSECGSYGEVHHLGLTRLLEESGLQP